jgi:hypothetical protein
MPRAFRWSAFWLLAKGLEGGVGFNAAWRCCPGQVVSAKVAPLVE